MAAFAVAACGSAAESDIDTDSTTNSDTDSAGGGTVTVVDVVSAAGPGTTALTPGDRGTVVVDTDRRHHRIHR